MFFKKKSTDESLKDADKALNKGLSGFMAKTFMGKEFVEQANQGLDQAKKYSSQGLAMTGLPAKAKVVAIQDMGMLVNNNPVVKLTLDVQPPYGVSFQTTGECPVSKIAIPKVGDEISIKYNAANTNEFVVV